MSEMTIVAMERTEEEKAAAEKRYAEAAPRGPDYPWGLCLNLGKDELEKLGITELPEAGSELRLYAIVCVTRVSQSAESGANTESKSVELQITHMGLEEDEEEEEEADPFSRAAKSLYDRGRAKPLGTAPGASARAKAISPLYDRHDIEKG